MKFGEKLIRTKLLSCLAFHTRFAVFFPLPSCCISSLFTPIPELYLTLVLLFQTLTDHDKWHISAYKIFTLLQVVGVVDITTLNNRQYCVILDPVDKDGKPQLGQKRLVKVRVADFFLSLESPCCALSKITLL